MGIRVGNGGSIDQVRVYNEKRQMISLYALKRDDLVVVYWKEAREHSTTFIDFDGTTYHRSLIEFECLDGDIFWGRVATNYSDWGRTNFPWSNVAHIRVGRANVMRFVEDLIKQMNKAENSVDQMRKNIDALKA